IGPRSQPSPYGGADKYWERGKPNQRPRLWRAEIQILVPRIKAHAAPLGRLGYCLEGRPKPFSGQRRGHLYGADPSRRCTLRSPLCGERSSLYGSRTRPSCSGLVAGSGVSRPQAQDPLADQNSITEHELTTLVTEQAMRDYPTLSPAQAFTKLFTDQS